MGRRADDQAAAAAGDAAAVRKAVHAYEAGAKAEFEAQQKALAEAAGKELGAVEPPIVAKPEEVCTKANAIVTHLKDSARAKPAEPAELQVDGEHGDASWQEVLGDLKARCTAAYTAADATVVVIPGQPGKTPLELALEECQELDRSLRGTISGAHPNSPHAKKLRTDVLADLPTPTGRAGWLTYFDHVIGVVEARQKRAQQGTLPEEERLPMAIVRLLSDLKAARDSVEAAPAQQGKSYKEDQTDWAPKVKLAVLALDLAIDAFARWMASVRKLPKARRDQLTADVFGRRPGDQKKAKGGEGDKAGGDKGGDDQKPAGEGDKAAGDGKQDEPPKA